jgi:hypothetical protein
MATLAHLVLSLAAVLALTGHPATASHRLVTRNAGRLPAGISEVDARFPSVRARTTRPAKVQRIMRWLERLPKVRPGRLYCPMLVEGPTISLVFRGRGRALARATFAARSVGHSLVSTQCTPIFLCVGGHRETPLVGGRFLLRVRRLLAAKPR